MKLKIRYENEFQTIELDAEATRGLWVTLSLEEDETLSEEEREQRLQEAVDEKLNRPEYNNYHKHQRHVGYSGSMFREEEDMDVTDILIKNAADPSVFYADEDDRRRKEDYEYYCQWVRKVLANKPEWAEAFIAVYLDGESIREYAARICVNENNITQKLKRAKKRLKDAWPDR